MHFFSPHDITHTFDRNSLLLTPAQQHPHTNHNLPLNHIALAVPSLALAVAWYEKHLGFRRVRNDRTSDRGVDGDDAPIFRIYGEGLRKVRIAWLVAGNGVGVEIFEFVEPGPLVEGEGWTLEGQVSLPGGLGWWLMEQVCEVGLADGFIYVQYRRGGVFHFCVTHPEPAKLAAEACEDGARQIGELVELGEGQTALYLRDPWGCVVEVLSCGYEQLMANRG